MNDFENLGSYINKAFSSIQVGESKKAFTVLDEWKRVLLRIKSNKNPNEGQNLVDHSRVIDLKNGILLIEADHPGWIEMLQLYKKFILTGLNMDMPDLKIKNLVFRLKGNSSEKFGNNITEEDSTLILEKKLQEEEKSLSEAYEKIGIKEDVSHQKKEMPDELKSIFDQLKNDMLTNEEN